jgi:hypothetical protein
MSDTPRTDAAVAGSDGQWSFVLRETSRELERELAQIKDANEDMRDLLREVYNLTQIGPGHHPQMPARALELIGILIEDKTPPP